MIIYPDIEIHNGQCVNLKNGSIEDPTIFDISDGALRITEGAGSPVAITNNKIQVSDLVFENVSNSLKVCHSLKV